MSSITENHTATASSSEKMMITLTSSDLQSFEIEEEVALESQTIKHMVEDGCAENAIPLPNVTGSVLAKIIEYCKKHAEDRKDKKEDNKELKAWDGEYIAVDKNVLFDLILAANYLNIEELLDLCCQKAADMIKGKTPEDIRKIFNIKNDFTAEEEAEIRKENQWAFE